MEVLMFALGALMIPIFGFGYMMVYMGSEWKKGKDILKACLILSVLSVLVGYMRIEPEQELDLSIIGGGSVILPLGILGAIAFTVKIVRNASIEEDKRLAALLKTEPDAMRETSDEEPIKTIAEFPNCSKDSVERTDGASGEEETSEIHHVDSMTGEDFEEYVGNVLGACGYQNVSTTAVTGDYGVDITAEKDFVKYAIQCKRWSGNVGVHAVQEVYSGREYYKANIAMVITNSEFTPNAKQLADRLGVVLVDRDKLMAMIETANHRKGGTSL